MLRLCDVVRAKFFMGPKQLKQLLADGGPKPLPPQVAANALADTQRWRTDQAATGGIVPRPGVPASAGTVEAMRLGLDFGSAQPLPAGVSGLLTGSATAPMSVSSRAIAPMGSDDDEDCSDDCRASSGSEAAPTTTAAAAEIVKPCAGTGCCDVPAAKAATTKVDAKANKRGRRGRGGRNNAAVAA